MNSHPALADTPLPPLGVGRLAWFSLDRPGKKRAVREWGVPLTTHRVSGTPFQRWARTTEPRHRFCVLVNMQLKLCVLPTFHP